MKARAALTTCAVMICVGSVWAVLAQRQQLATLRAERQAPTIATEESSAPAMESHGQTARESGAANSEELLRLRNEVTRLNARKRELANVVQENERLKSQLESGRTNAQAGNQLPAGYIRKAQAQFVGYSTPESTFQSFLWAVQNHEMTTLLKSLTPRAAEKLQEQFQDPGRAKEFFRDMDAMPGLALQNRKDQPDGSVQFEVEIAPGMPKETMSLQLINGEWKLEPF